MRRRRSPERARRTVRVGEACGVREGQKRAGWCTILLDASTVGLLRAGAAGSFPARPNPSPAFCALAALRNGVRNQNCLSHVRETNPHTWSSRVRGYRCTHAISREVQASGSAALSLPACCRRRRAAFCSHLLRALQAPHNSCSDSPARPQLRSTAVQETSGWDSPDPLVSRSSLLPLDPRFFLHSRTFRGAGPLQVSASHFPRIFTGTLRCSQFHASICRSKKHQEV